MSRVRTLVAVALCAVATLGPSAAGADAYPESRFPAAEAAQGVVTSLAVLPASGRAEVIISLDAHTKLQHFTLRSPERIVVDISGATLRLPARAYDGTRRAGIRDVRWSQFNRNVVRVVLTVDRKRDYVVERREGAIRITVKGDSGTTFAAWHAAGEQNAPQAVAERKEEPAPQAPAQDAPAPIKEAPAPAQDATAAAPATTLGDVGATNPQAPGTGMAEVQAPGTVLAGAPRDAAPEPRNAAMASTNRERPAMQQRQQQPRISVAWSNADIREVLAQFAAFSGRTIIVGRGVNATVTAEIIDQPWDVAMAAILSSQGLAATEDLSGIIVVDTYENIAQRRTSEPLATRTLRLNYARATQAAENLRQRLTRDCSSRQGGGSLRQPQGTLTDNQAPTADVGLSGPTDLSCPIRGAVTADSLTNSISITDVPGALPGLVEYARSLDIRQPQVAIKAKIVLVDRTSLEALGIKYDIGTRTNFFNTLLPRLDSIGEPLKGSGRFELGGNALAGVANASVQVPNAALSLIYSAALGRFDLSVFLDALQETTLLDVQSEPSVVTLNNRTAELRAGVEVPIRVIEANAGGGGSEGNFPRATVQLRQTGIILNVTPQITANRQIIMRVVAENSDVDFRSSDVGAVFPTQRVENEMLVADGETAVMGGLTQTRVNVTKSGIPILVDLPIIGRLFGVTQRSESKRDLLILITPHIVDEGQTVPDASDDR